TLDWEVPYRAERIAELILARSNHDMESMKAAQADVVSLAALHLKALMIDAVASSPGIDQSVLARLRAWDGAMRGEAAEPLIYTAWVRQAVEAIYRDDLGPAFARFFNSHAEVLIRLLERRATGRDWCDDRTTPAHESCAQVLALALRHALVDLERPSGRARSRGRWDEAHLAWGEHNALGDFPLLGAIFNIRVPSPGGDYTLNRGKVEFAASPPFANRHASSYRAIYDLSNLDGSLY